jgi:MFS family permease
LSSSSTPEPPETGPPPEGIAAWAVFAFRDYRLLWASLVSHTMGQQLRLLVTAVWLFEETGSAATLGVLGLIQLFVQVPALLYGGTFADRFDRKQLMMLTQAVTFATILVLAALVSAGRLEPWHVYLASALTSITTVFGQPAGRALTAMVVPRTHLMHAVTNNNINQQIGSVAAPLLFAIVAETVGLAATFWLTAAAIAPSVVLPPLIAVSGRPEGVGGGSMIRSIIEGFWFVVRHPILPGLFLLDTGITVVSFYRQVLPAIAQGLFRGGAGATGVLTSANSAGAIGGAFLVLGLANYRAKGMMVLYATIAYSLLLFAFGSASSLIIGAVIIAGLGAADSVSVTMRQSTVQLTTPDHMRGRTLSFTTLSAQTANNVGTIWVGFMSAWIGEGSTMILGGVLSLAATLVIWRTVRGIREYRYP